MQIRLSSGHIFDVQQLDYFPDGQLWKLRGLLGGHSYYISYRLNEENAAIWSDLVTQFLAHMEEQGHE